MLTMAPPPCFIAAMPCLQPRKQDSALIRIRVWNCANGACSMSPAIRIPALLIRISSGPRRCCTAPMAAPQSGSLVTSWRRKIARSSPSSPLIFAASAWPASALMSLIAIRAPSRASSHAVSSPIPLAPPVTNPTLSCTRPLMACSRSLAGSWRLQQVGARQRDRFPGEMRDGAIGKGHRRTQRGAGAGVGRPHHRGAVVADAIQTLDHLAAGIQHAPIAIGQQPALGADVAGPQLHRVERRLGDRCEVGVRLHVDVAVVAVEHIAATIEIEVLAGMRKQIGRA